MMDFLTREVFDTLIIVVIVIGLALAAVRLYADLTRPMPPGSTPKRKSPPSPVTGEADTTKDSIQREE